MILCEILLVGLMCVVGLYAIVTDFQKGIIRNRALAIAVLIGLLINCFYYGMWARAFFKTFCLNLFVLAVLAIGLYAFHFWAAGDSKLLICLAFLFPSRLYDAKGSLTIQGIAIAVLIFLIAYVYVLSESVIQSIKGVDFFYKIEFSWKRIGCFLLKYAIGFLYLRGMSQIFHKIFLDYYNQNPIIFMFINIFIAIVVQSYDIFRKWYSLSIILLCNVLLYEGSLFGRSSWKGYGILLLAMLLRYFVSGYNYQEISTNTVESGMILSYGTITQFIGSRVRGLPTYTKEDMSTRISEEEAAAIKCWEKSKYGKAEIVIVRKLPFAVFIVLGVIAFLIIRLVMV